MADVTLTAYNVKLKKKCYLFRKLWFPRTAKGGYIAKGHDSKGNKLTALLGEAKALAAIKSFPCRKTRLVKPTNNI